jgi:hypothetical protein
MKEAAEVGAGRQVGIGYRFELLAQSDGGYRRAVGI